MTAILQRIAERQRRITSTQLPLLPPHRPEMLMIGCIDARVDPIGDLGVPKGKALIYRNPASLVRPYSDKGEEGGNRTMAGTLEFAIDVMQVKHIVVMGHTHCGAIHACYCGVDHSTHPNLYKYLKPLLDMVETSARSHDDEESHLRELEQAGVRESIKNLMSYDLVRQAVDQGKLELHGWMIDIVSLQIAELDPLTGSFVPMKIST
jgi:carbonic anhydrase